MQSGSGRSSPQNLTTDKHGFKDLKIAIELDPCRSVLSVFISGKVFSMPTAQLSFCAHTQDSFQIVRVNRVQQGVFAIDVALGHQRRQ